MDAQTKLIELNGRASALWEFQDVVESAIGKRAGLAAVLKWINEAQRDLGIEQLTVTRELERQKTGSMRPPGDNR